MRMSDIVAQYITQMLEETGGNAEIQRNELAQTLGCVPSQINYVLTSRFTPEQGYIVESRRGGGGYIRIVRANVPASQMVMHAINGVGDSIDQPTAEAFIRNLYQAGAIGQESGRLLLALMGDKALAAAPQAGMNRPSVQWRW